MLNQQYVRMGSKVDEGDSPATDLHTFEYSPNGNETVVEAVLNAVSAVTNIPVLPSDSPGSGEGRGESLPPLYNTIDPDALANLSPAATDEDANWQVTFPYAGCNVTVTSTGTVLVDEQSSVADSGD
ncbi:HalOD1 output domain-containing protein [Natronosalvus rutilus]|uniref:Halobacterial output domain-containing protein n=1 Tax=Natronosalvus rutilus TaxID=2953753 RepID=A0A9E7NAM5_9EURY|nr:HalOD1 output domain-containing protein [Natronosalvus rutilus]UTF54767.1 hypothetical protein NGM29_05730 [Natronosalvus rutilus]